MLSRWEKKVLTGYVAGETIKPENLRLAKCRAKKRLLQAVADIKLLIQAFPEMEEFLIMDAGVAKPGQRRRTEAPVP